ncbi:MAG TPA: hypothetical protein PKM65_08720 [Spirochaetota bacterium]|nr:hypothetical protein [Spirochaetota bacterium]HNT12488.1 hypothetical protein [Spirochaetota bacterium]HNV46324.1 hypothetical protein [Spirochaetota bacterium]HOS38494.1 hypothetical protein [Spirochaetota bacterium]HPI22056.1 hypothetical protein [Spirochaetota bacterium]
MKVLRLEIGRSFKLENFKKSFKLTWLYSGIGLLIFLVFLSFSGLVQDRSFFYYFFQNAGMFLMFTLLLMAYAGVYRITKFPEDATKVTRTSIRETAKKAHIIVGTSITTVIVFFAVVMIEVGISSISMIPYAGPLIIALFTIPIFIINFACLLLAICVFAIVPPLVGEFDSVKEIFTELRHIIRHRWLNVIIYLIISLSILFLSMVVIYFLVRYATGVTKAVQWKINAAYPKLMNALTLKSYFTDLIYKITPQPDPADALKRYGMDLFHYLDILRYIVSISYLAVLSFIASFPLAAYFNISSAFFKSIWKAKKKA